MNTLKSCSVVCTIICLIICLLPIPLAGFIIGISNIDTNNCSSIINLNLPVWLVIDACVSFVVIILFNILSMIYQYGSSGWFRWVVVGFACFVSLTLFTLATLGILIYTSLSDDCKPNHNDLYIMGIIMTLVNGFSGLAAIPTSLLIKKIDFDDY